VPAALVFIVSLLFESVGVATGWSMVHIITPPSLALSSSVSSLPDSAAWFMMSYPSFVIADRLVPSAWRRWQRVLSVAAVGGLVMTAWDLSWIRSWCGRELGLGCERCLLRHSTAELLGLVADHFHHLCALPVVVWQGRKTAQAGFDRLALWITWLLHWGLWLPRWSPARVGWH